VSYERDRRQGAPGRGPGHAPASHAPGKVTLTEALTGTPGSPRAELRRNLVWPEEAGRDVRAPGAAARVADPAGGDVAALAASSSTAELDHGFTPALVAALRAHPSLDIDELLVQLATDAIGAAPDVPLDQPAIVQAGASSLDHMLRAAAMTSLQQAKHRLLAASRQRNTTPRQLDDEIHQHESRAPAPGDVEATRQWSRIRDAMCAARPKVQRAFDLAVDQLWTPYARMLRMLRRIVRHPDEPPEIDDHDTLAAQLSYLDELWNACLRELPATGNRLDTTGHDPDT
jgi:hypothetical protein